MYSIQQFTSKLTSRISPNQFVRIKLHTFPLDIRKFVTNIKHLHFAVPNIYLDCDTTAYFPPLNAKSRFTVHKLLTVFAG